MVDEEYFLRHPSKQLFYKITSIIITLCSLGSHNWWGFTFPKCIAYFLKFHYYLIFCAAPTVFWSQIAYMKINFGTMSLGSHSTILTLLPTSFMIWLKVMSSKTSDYKKLMKSFPNKIHLHNFFKNGPYEKEMLIEVERYTRHLARFFIVLLLIDWVLWTITPILINIQYADVIKNKTKPLTTNVYMWMPFDFQYNHKNWCILHMINTFTIGGGCSIISMSDTINYSIVFHLIGHIKIMKHKIITKLCVGLSDTEIKDNLTEVIKYQCFVFRIFKEVESAFGMNVSINYFYNLIADSMMLYQMMMAEEGGNKIKYGLMLLVFMGGLILMTCVMEEVRRQTDDIAELIYNTPWEDMSVSNQKTIRMMLAQAQPTLEFKAAGGLRAGVRPTINIFKSTFSYYVMLNSSL